MSKDRALEKAYPYIIGILCGALAFPATGQCKAGLVSELAPQYQ